MIKEMKATLENLCKELGTTTIHTAILAKNKEQISDLKGTTIKTYYRGGTADMTLLRRESELDGRSKKTPQMKHRKTEAERRTETQRRSTGRIHECTGP